MRMFLKRGDRHTSIVFFLVLLIILEVAAFQQSFGRIGKSIQAYRCPTEMKGLFGPEGPTLNDLADLALHIRRLIASVRVPLH